MKKKNIKLHLGVHKTGTTLLQTQILRTGLVNSIKPDQSIAILSMAMGQHGYFSFREKYADLRNRIIIRERDSLAHNNAILEMKDLIRSYISSIDADLIIWSDENLIGHPPGHLIGQNISVAKGLYSSSDVILECFNNALSEYDVQVRLTKREKKGFLKSLHKDWLAKLRDTVLLEDFSIRAGADTWDWISMVQPLKELFGSEFSITHYECLAHNPKEFVEEFLFWCGLQIAADLDDSFLTPVNKSLSAQQLELRRNKTVNI